MIDGPSPSAHRIVVVDGAIEAIVREDGIFARDASAAVPSALCPAERCLCGVQETATAASRIHSAAFRVLIDR